LLFATISIFMVIIFLSFNLIADILYEKILKTKFPSTKVGEINYYMDSLNLISKAINLNKANAEYLVLKADLLSCAFNENFKETLFGDKEDIEKLYIKAIKLNPIDFEYHLKLGWFYAQTKDKRAEDEIEKAISLFPVYYRNYIYLSKYYLMNNDDKKAFVNMLLALYYGKNLGGWNVMVRLKEDIKNHINFSLWGTGLLFQTEGEGPVFDFKKYGFGHSSFPLTLRVYLQKSENRQVLLYKNEVLFARFQKLQSTGELDVYEFKIDPRNTDIYLDELRIRIQPLQNIEKIDFIKEF